MRAGRVVPCELCDPLAHDEPLVLAHDHAAALRALVHDPVCGMLAGRAEVPASIAQEGMTLYFCSRGCREEFPAHTNTPMGYTRALSTKEAIL